MLTNSIISDGWEDYELIDSGEREKLERFGKFILRRPEPQALWNKSLDESVWEKKSDAAFIRSVKKNSDKTEISGVWKKGPGIPDHWNINLNIGKSPLKALIKFTSSGHVGLFPEQKNNWEFIAEKTFALSSSRVKPRILNLFAYTGMASLAGLAAGAEIVHLDAVKQMINWTEKNRELSELPGSLHLVVEDALKFIRREHKRNRLYDGIILDPPVYGRGPKGEKWQLGENIYELISGVSGILNKDKGFLVLNWYSIGLSPYVMLNLVKEFFPDKKPAFGEMIIRSGTGNYLPLGTYLRFG